MNLTRCSNGHFYDMDKFDSCPHCASGSNESRTAPLNSPSAAQGGNFVGGNGQEVTEPYFGDSNPANRASYTDRTEPLSKPFNPSTDTTEKTESVQNPGFYVGNEPGPAPQTPVSPTPITPAPITPQPAPWNMNITETPDDEKTVGIYFMKDQNDKARSRQTYVEPVVGWLVCIKGSAFGRSFTLKSGRNFIGRDASQDVTIPGDKSISRECHAVAVYDPKSKKFIVQPGTSRELFYLNDGVVLGVEEMVSNDILTIGNTDLMFVPCCGPNFTWEEQIEKNKEKEEE
ncbi:MAG: FHA domain-containing protein [Clostridiales bacterium]|nr:FHA domain-containing protein [Clostridiales bacterium]